MTDIQRFSDVQVEALVLGCALSGSFSEIAGKLHPSDFFDTRHGMVMEAMECLSADGPPAIDRVAHYFERNRKLEELGGLRYLTDLQRDAIPGIPLASFIKILKEKSQVRRAVAIVEKLGRSLDLDGLNGNRLDIVACAEELQSLAAASTEDVPELEVDDFPPVAVTDEPIRYVRKPELPEGAIVAVTGDSGSGKSTLVTAWCRDAIRDGYQALVLDRENPRGVVMDRMGRLGLQDGPSLRWAGGWMPNGAPDPASPKLLRWINACDAKPLIVVDSFVAFFQGDENNAVEVRAFFNGLRRLADLGATIVLIHHDGKGASARDYRGSSDFKAAVDQAFHVANLSSDGKLDRLTVRCFKSRYAHSGSLIYRYAEGLFERDERKDAAARTEADRLTELLRSNPGINGDKFEKEGSTLGITRKVARDFLVNGVLAGVVELKTGSNNARRYYMAVSTD